MIKHNPRFIEERVKSQYGDCHYVCTSEIGRDGWWWDIYYRNDCPHPEYGNRYFGLTTKGDNVYIRNADSVEQEEFSCIKDSEGNWHYSEYGHHYHDIDTGAIDGGRGYCRVISSDKSQFPETKVFIVKDGIFMEKQNETTTEV